MPFVIIPSTMDLNLANLFHTSPVSGVTINSVDLPGEVRTLVLLVMAGVVTVSIARFLLHAPRPPLRSALRAAVLPSFLLSGLVYAGFADLTWSRWISTDLVLFGGRTVDQKLARLESEWMPFVDGARMTIPDSYQLYASSDPVAELIALRVEYDLLPLRKRRDAPHIVVLRDSRATYDSATNTFVRGDVVINNVRPVFRSSPTEYILARDSK
jgi:hypothetical protein